MLISRSVSASFGMAGVFLDRRDAPGLHVAHAVFRQQHHAPGHEEEGDSSKNLWWLGPLQLTAWGENWHRNHHSNAGSARLGLRWWQPDVGWYLIWALEAVGLASGVKRPNMARINSRSSS